MRKSELENETFLMYDCSFKRMKDLRPGDQLMGADSKPCTILNIERKMENNYLVSPVKGNSYIVGESHTLAVNISGEFSMKKCDDGSIEIRWFSEEEMKMRRKKFNINKHGEKTQQEVDDFVNGLNIKKRFGLMVSEYVKAPNSSKHKIKGYKVPLDFEEQEVEIDPYIVGVWLGDGTSRDPVITTIDKEIVDYFSEYFSKFNLKINQMGKRGIHYGVTRGKQNPVDNVFRTFLRESNLQNNKHIPMNYLINSKENRLKLLAGLIDTDGSLSSGCFDFIQKNEDLFDDFLFLCGSLGFSCYKSKQKKSYKTETYYFEGEYFRTVVSGNLDQVPTLLERKKAKPRKQIKDHLVTGIKLEKLTRFTNYRIITDTPLFLMEDFTVRHSC